MAAVASPLMKPPELGASDRLLRSAVYCRAEASAGKVAPNGEAFDVRIVASTARVARDGGIIEAKAWARDLSRYLANPVVQWCHDYEEPPIATCVYVVVDEQRGLLDAYWRFLDGISDDEWDRFAGRLKALYAVKGLNACSVGFIVHEYRDPTNEEKLAALQAGETEPYWVAVRAELLEQSAVPVPSDPNALAIDRAFGDAKRKGIKVDELEARWAKAKAKPAAAARTAEPAAADAREIESPPPGVAVADCPGCGKDVPADAKVCPFCGATMPANPPVEAKEGDGRAPTAHDAEWVALVDRSMVDLANTLTALTARVGEMLAKVEALESVRIAAPPAEAESAIDARVARWIAEGERALAAEPPKSPSAPSNRLITDHITRAVSARMPDLDLLLQRRLGLPPASTH